MNSFDPYSISFARATLFLSRFIDFIGVIRNKLDYKSLKDGKVEGWTLLVFVLWWVAGTVVITRSGSVAYEALNGYFSTWTSLFACIHALDQWGKEKEILTIHELTRLSITLPFWWILFFSSIVVFGSAADSKRLVKTESAEESCIFAVAVGMVSAAVSTFFILSHYEFLQCCEACRSWMTYGGWLELVLSLLLNLWLIIGLDYLTSAGRIASTIVGNGVDPESDDFVPGSNIYASIWLSFIASTMVTMRWKEARSLQFAQTAGDGQTNVEVGVVMGNGGDSDADDNI